jgi:hypothetical protein
MPARGSELPRDLANQRQSEYPAVTGVAVIAAVSLPGLSGEGVAPRAAALRELHPIGDA